MSCTLDSDDTSLDLTAEISTSIKTQKANADFDTSKKGIYHGIFTSGLAESKGMVWVNLGNDKKYSAIVQLSNGSEYTFKLVNRDNQETEPTSYTFVNAAGSFVLDVSSPGLPFLVDATLNNLVHLGAIFKNTSTNRAMGKTGTFSGGLSGTWNLMYDEAITIPSQGDTNPLIDVVVTYDPDGPTGPIDPIMKTDNVFETMGLDVDCLFGFPTPYFSSPFLANPKDMCANEQTSNFGGSGLTSWSIQHNTIAGSGYTCSSSGGAGVWSRDGGAVTGTIGID